MRANQALRRLGRSLWFRYDAFRIIHLRMSQLALRLKARNPATFSGFILHKMAFDRDLRLSMYADKVRAKEHVKDLAGDKYLIKNLLVTNSLRGYSQEDLPRSFVVKANHGSGALVLVWEGAKRGERLPTKLGRENWERFSIHPDDLDWEALLNLSDLWMTQNYYHHYGIYPEWAYLNIDPRIIVEELVVTELGIIPTDYKFTMFHGKCDYIAVISGGHAQDQLVNLLDPEWNDWTAESNYKNYPKNLAKPKHLREMIELAETLSAGIDFIRVDLYETSDGVKFGELTNYPSAGNLAWATEQIDQALGRRYQLSFPPNKSSKPSKF
jgi:hypothetical protein